MLPEGGRILQVALWARATRWVRLAVGKTSRVCVHGADGFAGVSCAMMWVDLGPVLEARCVMLASRALWHWSARPYGHHSCLYMPHAIAALQRGPYLECCRLHAPCTARPRILGIPVSLLLLRLWELLRLHHLLRLLGR